jgi:hypothetical protein
VEVEEAEAVLDGGLVSVVVRVVGADGVSSAAGVESSVGSAAAASSVVSIGACRA